MQNFGRQLPALAGSAAWLMLALVLWRCWPVLGRAGAQEPASLAEQEALRHGWLLDLARGFQQARQTGKPLLVVLRCVP
jgi:hypothetical protein